MPTRGLMSVESSLVEGPQSQACKSVSGVGVMVKFRAKAASSEEGRRVHVVDFSSKQGGRRHLGEASPDRRADWS